MEVDLYVGASDMVRVWPDDVPYMERFVRSEDFDSVVAERDTLQSRLNSVEVAAREMMRIAGIANQGSNAYNRAIINLHQALEKNS